MELPAKRKIDKVKNSLEAIELEAARLGMSVDEFIAEAIKIEGPKLLAAINAHMNLKLNVIREQKLRCTFTITSRLQNVIIKLDHCSSLSGEVLVRGRMPPGLKN